MSELVTDNPRFTPNREDREDGEAPATPAQETELLPRGNHVPAGTGSTITVTSPDMGPDTEQNFAANENGAGFAHALAGSSLRH